MSRYAVTGASGFLGKHLVAVLRGAGHEVVALCRDHSEELLALGAELRKADVLDRASLLEGMKGCEGLFHLAGKVSRKKEDAELLWNVHVKGTENAILAAHEAGIKRVVYASTSGVVAVGTDAQKLHNEDDDAPIGIIQHWPYYRSKLFAEQKAFALGKSLGIELVSLNPSLLLGPGDTYGSSTKDIELILEGKIAAIPPGGISFTDVRDTAEMMWVAMQKGQAGRRYLLSGCNLTLRTFVGRVARIGGVSAPMLRLPRWSKMRDVLTGAAKWAEKHFGENDGLDPLSLDMACHYWYVDTTRAQEELGFSPRDPMRTLEDTIEELMPTV